MRRSWIVVAMSLLAACPSPDDPNPAPSAGPVADGFVAVVTAMDARMLTCAGVAWWDANDDLAATAAALQASADAGRLLADQAALDACAASVAAYTCAETLRNGDEPGCLEPTLTANVAAAGDCMEDLECVGGFCDYTLGTCPGTCVAFAAEGQGCGALRCGPGLGCQSGLCVAETTVAVGAPCGFLNVCEPSANCRLDTGAAAYLCTLPGAAGETCDWNTDCAEPLLCIGGACATLTPTGVPCDALAACNPNFDYCDPATNLCAPLPVAAESCLDSGDCAGEAFCDPADDLCKSIPGVGESCSAAGECSGAAFCDGTCKAIPVDGESCAISRECAAGLFCQKDASNLFTTCAPRVAAGGTCLGRVTFEECVDGYYCDYAYPDPGTCVAQKGAGAACVHDDACQDDLECWDVCTVTSCWP